MEVEQAKGSPLKPDVRRRGGANEHSHNDAVRRMFDRISPTYDLANRVMSLGLDAVWRAAAVEELAHRAVGGPLLDVCAGTLDLAAAMERRFPGDRRIVASDFARRMLVEGRAKLNPMRSRLVVADACALPFADNVFGGAACGFGIRNVGDTKAALTELHRCLKPAAPAVFLEFFRPTKRRSKLFHGVYARFVMPTLGRGLSKDDEAYEYLVQSMQGFYSLHEFEELARSVGFNAVRGRDLTMGVAAIVVCTKPVGES